MYLSLPTGPPRALAPLFSELLPGPSLATVDATDMFAATAGPSGSEDQAGGSLGVDVWPLCILCAGGESSALIPPGLSVTVTVLLCRTFVLLFPGLDHDDEVALTCLLFSTDARLDTAFRDDSWQPAQIQQR